MAIICDITFYDAIMRLISEDLTQYPLCAILVNRKTNNQTKEQNKKAQFFKKIYKGTVFGYAFFLLMVFAVPLTIMSTCA